MSNTSSQSLKARSKRHRCGYPSPLSWYDYMHALDPLVILVEGRGNWDGCSHCFYAPNGLMYLPDVVLELWLLFVCISGIDFSSLVRLCQRYCSSFNKRYYLVPHRRTHRHICRLQEA